MPFQHLEGLGVYVYLSKAGVGLGCDFEMFPSTSPNKHVLWSPRDAEGWSLIKTSYCTYYSIPDFVCGRERNPTLRDDSRLEYLAVKRRYCQHVSNCRRACSSCPRSEKAIQGCGRGRRTQTRSAHRGMLRSSGP